MAMDKLSFTIGELITIASLIVSVTTSYVLLKNDVKNIQDDITKVHTLLDKNANRMEEQQATIDVMRAEQYRMNMLLNFVYGEGAKFGWTMGKKYTDGVLRELKDKPWLTEEEKKKRG